MVVVTHEEDIAAFTERIIRFRDGRIISDERRGRTGREDTPKEVEEC